MADTSGLRQSIVNAINKVRTDSGRPAVECSDDAALTDDLGLDSLDLAVLVVSLEKELGVDPFRDGTANARTLRDLVAVYSKARS